jgi:hypothetical protein
MARTPTFREILTRGVTRRPDVNDLDDPSATQTDDEISDYFQNVKIGDQAAIRDTQNRWLRFTITTIDNIKPERGRLYVTPGSLEGGSAYYRKTGKSCLIPRGQISLVIPTEAVLAWIGEHPGGVLAGPFGPIEMKPA